MRSREQIYRKEATQLLRDISTYQAIRHDQLLRMYPGKEEKTENLLRHLVRQGRIVHRPKENIYCCDAEVTPEPEMLAALWVLIDFVEQIEYHSAADFPAKLVFLAQRELYEVIYVAVGQEAIVEVAVGNRQEDVERRFVIVEDPQQISNLHIPQVYAYCTVDRQTGEVQYFKGTVDV